MTEFSQTSTSNSPPRARGGLPAWLGWGLGALLAVGAAVWFAQDRLSAVEREVARRLQGAETLDLQRDQQLKLLSDTLRDAQTRTAVLEAKLAESSGQQAQLRALYDEMARTRGDLMLADAENSIMIAAQQLQVAGNVQAALLALQDADQVLARSSQPAMIGLRRIVQRDIEQLKAVPVADFTAAVNRLDGVIAALDQMPLLADVAPAEPAQPAAPAAAAATPPAAAAAAPASGLQGLTERIARTGSKGWDGFVAEIKQLLRVQRIDQSEALLLAPDQRWFVRESLRLQLLNARLNLLARNEPLLRKDLARATESIERHFDRQNRTVTGALASLAQLQATRFATELPSLADSTAAVRAARAASEPARR